MKRFAAVRFAGVLAANERDGVARSLASVGAQATSWNVAADRSYATLVCDFEVAPAAAVVRDLVHAASPGATLAMPPCVVLRVTPACRIRDVADALAGPGRPAGIVAAFEEGDAIVVEIDVRTTRLSAVVALIDAATAGARRIDAVLPLEDGPLAELAGAVLGDPGIDAARTIEAWLEPLLARARA